MGGMATSSFVAGPRRQGRRRGCRRATISGFSGFIAVGRWSSTGLGVGIATSRPSCLVVAVVTARLTVGYRSTTRAPIRVEQLRLAGGERQGVGRKPTPALNCLVGSSLVIPPVRVLLLDC